MLPPNLEKYNKAPPLAAEILRHELVDYLEQAPYLVRPLSEWELDFCTSLLRQLRYGRPTPRQNEVLDRGLLRKLWGEDPRLWE